MGRKTISKNSSKRAGNKGKVISQFVGVIMKNRTRPLTKEEVDNKAISLMPVIDEADHASDENYALSTN